MKKIIRLNSNNFTENVWGGTWIPAVKGAASTHGLIGESWEFSTHPKRPNQIMNGSAPSESLINLFPAIAGRGQTAPFLIKIIDACQALSLQVHPNETYARQTDNDAGKAESWYVLETGGGPDDGILYLGFNPDERKRYASQEKFADAFRAALEEASARGPMSEESERRAAAESVLRFVNRARVRAGDAFHLPPGTIHAIGAGVRLYEIQQSSDLTYRVWDWNRADPKAAGPAMRPLHGKKAFDVLDFAARPFDAFRLKIEAAPGEKIPREIPWVECREGAYRASLLELEAGSALTLDTRNEFQVLTVLSGAVRVEAEGENSEDVDAYGTAVVAATVPRYRVHATKAARVIRAQPFRA